jgi:hypothetical protein
MPYGECPKCHAVCHPPTPKHRSYIDGYPIDPSMVQWRFSGPEKAIEWNMLAVVEIAGTSYHLEAIQMDRQDKAWNPESRHIVDFLRSETDNEALDTAEIEGRNYVIWMHPFSR